MAPENNLGRIETAGDLVNTFDNRDELRLEAQDTLDRILEQINQAQGVLDAEGLTELVAAAQLARGAALQGDKHTIGFALELTGHIANGGNTKEFIEKNPHYRELQIGDSVDLFLEETLSTFPLTSPLLQPGDKPLIPLLAVEPSPIPDKPSPIIDIKETAPDQDLDEEIALLSQQYPAVGTLYKTDNLWITHKPEGAREEQRYTTQGNISILLATNDWDKKALARAAVTMTKIVRGWKSSYKNEFGTDSPDGKIPGHGPNKFYSEKETLHLIRFMHENLGTKIRSKKRITEENITRWPFDTSAKPKAKPQPAETVSTLDKDKVGVDPRKKYPAVKTLFETPELWLVHKDKEGQEPQRYTTQKNISILLIGNDWDKRTLNSAGVSMISTIIPRWETAYKLQFGKEVTNTIIPNYGNHKLYSEQEILHLIAFMQENLGTKIRSKKRITEENITRWPFDTSAERKKKR